MKDLKQILVGFMAASLPLIVLSSAWAGVAIFVASILLQGFLGFLDRKKFDEQAEIKRELTEVKNQLSGMIMRWG